MALHSNGVRTVAIEKLDRLTRDLMVQETIFADLNMSPVSTENVVNSHSQMPSGEALAFSRGPG